MEPLSELPVGGCSDVWEWAGRALSDRKETGGSVRMDEAGPVEHLAAQVLVPEETGCLIGVSAAL